MPRVSHALIALVAFAIACIRRPGQIARTESTAARWFDPAEMDGGVTLFFYAYALQQRSTDRSTAAQRIRPNRHSQELSQTLTRKRRPILRAREVLHNGLGPLPVPGSRDPVCSPNEDRAAGWEVRGQRPR